MAVRPPSTADQKFLDLAKRRFKQGETAENNQRIREIDDLKFYAGEQWPADILAARSGQTLNQSTPPVPARPTLTINLTREPVRQILNQERQADMGIELVPADDFGGLAEPIDHTEIKLREGLVRRIQRDSEGQDARTWGFERAVIAGRGYWGVMTRYAPGKTSDQEVYIQRFFNQAAVMLDPAHEQPDGSDAEWAFVGKDYTEDEYTAEFGTVPKDGTKNYLCECDESAFRALGDDVPDWFKTEKDVRIIRVVDYYYTVYETKDLAMFQDGRAEFVEDLPEGTDPKSYTTRRMSSKSIKWAKLDGYQILDETDWPGHYLPIIKVIGEELQPYDKERRCEGMIRPSIDPCRSSNYMISKWVETVGLSPIPQWIMAAGQDEGFTQEWDNINTRTLGRVHYNQEDVNGKPAPPPARISAAVDVQGIAQAVTLFGELTNKVMATPETSLGQVDPSIKSGKLAKLIMERGQQGTSNFLDNLVRSMRHEARIVNDLLYPIYGRPGRLARLMNPQGKMETVKMGQPVNDPQSQGQPQGQPKVYQLTKDAEWNVAIKVSKNSDTRREQITGIIGDIVSADPGQLAIVGDLLWKYADAPDHEEISERYRVMLAPPIQQMLSGKQPLPPEVQAQMAQMQQMVEQLKELADKNLTDLKKTHMQQQSEDARTAADVLSKERIAMRELEVKLEIEMAKLGSAQSMARGELEQQQLHQHNEQVMRREELQVQTAQTAIDRQVESQEAAAGRDHDREMNERGHQQSLEQGQQAAQQASALSAQNAAQQPTPEPAQ